MSELPGLKHSKVEQNGAMVSVFIAGPHELINTGIATLLEGRGIQVIGQCTRASQIIGGVELNRPRVTLIDRAIPDINLLETLRVLRLSRPETRTVLMAPTFHPRQLAKYRRLGVNHIILKSDDPDELARTIMAAGNNKPYGSLLASDLIRRSSDLIALRDDLTDREEEILLLLASGFTNSAIAKMLDRSVKTVETHRSHIIEKTCARDGADLRRVATTY